MRVNALFIVWTWDNGPWGAGSPSSFVMGGFVNRPDELGCGQIRKSLETLEWEGPAPTKKVVGQLPIDSSRRRSIIQSPASLENSEHCQMSTSAFVSSHYEMYGSSLAAATACPDSDTLCVGKPINIPIQP